MTGDGSAPDGLPDEEAKTGSHLWEALPGVAADQDGRGLGAWKLMGDGAWWNDASGGSRLLMMVGQGRILDLCQGSGNIHHQPVLPTATRRFFSNSFVCHTAVLVKSGPFSSTVLVAQRCLLQR